VTVKSAFVRSGIAAAAISDFRI